MERAQGLPADGGQIPHTPVHDKGVPTAYRKYLISGMTCAACAARIEKVVHRVPGVAAVFVSLSTDRAYVQFEDRAGEDASVLRAIQKAGYDASVDTQAHADLRAERETQAYETLWNRWFIASVATLVLMVDMWLAMRMGKAVLPVWCEWALATLVQGLVGLRFYRGAFNALRGRTANMDVLVALASGTSYMQSTVLALSKNGTPSFDGAAMVLVMVSLGKLLETRAKRRVSAWSRNTSAAAKPLAHRIGAHGVEDTLPEQLLPGHHLVVYAEEIVPTDVVVLQGTAVVDESFLTGESHPVTRRVGDTVYGGSKNLAQPWSGSVLTPADDTFHAHLQRRAELAQMERSAARAWVDRVTAVFVPLIGLTAMATFALQRLVGDSGHAVQDAIAVLVAACPCALGLATPMALAVGLQVGLRRGVCLQNEERLSQLAKVDTIVFDKTGTLTTGRLQVMRVQSRPRVSSEALLTMAAAVEDGVAHPVARAVMAAARERGITWARDGSATPHARGVSKRVAGHDVYVGEGTVSALAETRLRTGADAAAANHAPLERSVIVQSDGVWLGTLWFADEIRPEAKRVVQSLRRVGMDVWMLTGDTEASARWVAQTLNLGAFRAALDSGGKQQMIQELQRHGRTVAMVGDGVNDAAALASADVGIAFGAMAEESITAADIAILGGDLRQVLWSTRLARAMLAKIRQNLTWAVLYNAVSVPLACVGIMNPMWASIGMAFSSVLVMSNSLLLERFRG